MNLLITTNNSRLATIRATLLVQTTSRTRLATMTTLLCSFFSGGSSASTIIFITGESEFWVCLNSSCFVVTSPAILIGRAWCCSSIGTSLEWRPDGVVPLFTLLIVGFHFDISWEAWHGRTNVMIKSASRWVAFMMCCSSIWFAFLKNYEWRTHHKPRASLLPANCAKFLHDDVKLLTVYTTVNGNPVCCIYNVLC